jgi:hypothetical protein
LPELRHESFTLNLADKSIRQITFDVTTDLCEILAILNRDHEQETAFSLSFAPIPIHAQLRVNNQRCRGRRRVDRHTAYSIFPRSFMSR